MQIIKLEDRIIYRAAKGKKVKFVNDEREYYEIVVDYDDNREVIETDEVRNGNL